MHTFNSAVAAYRAIRDKVETTLSEEDVSRLVDELGSLTVTLMGTPAPDVAALVLKIEIAMAEAPVPGGGGLIEAPHAAAILRDARALA